MYTGLDVKYPLFSSDCYPIGFSRQNFEKYSNIKFHANPSSASRVVPCEGTDSERARQMGKGTKRHDETSSRFSQFCHRA